MIGLLPSFGANKPAGWTWAISSRERGLSWTRGCSDDIMVVVGSGNQRAGLPRPASGGPSAAPFDFAQDKLRTGVGAASAEGFQAKNKGLFGMNYVRLRIDRPGKSV